MYNNIEMKIILIKMIKVILIKNINDNKYSNEINNVNDIIKMGGRRL